MRASSFAMLLLVAISSLLVTGYVIHWTFPLTTQEPIRITLELGFLVIVGFVIYELVSQVIRTTILRSKGTEGEAKMLVGLWKFLVIFILLLIVLDRYFQLGNIGAIVGAFGGMFLGWSLQQPVSGFAAWLLITLKRPFRVGDRVQLPSYGLVGDCIDIGPMYTVLNQVGGSVGSEEAVGRDILIPNAMLFGNLVINYTPRKTEIKIEPKGKEQIESYILDEVVWNIPLGSNLDEAEKVLIKSAEEVTADIIAKTGQKPYVRGESYSSGVTLRLRYMTLATDRPRIAYEINKRIFRRLFQPYKVGDRISIPSWGIVGDVVDFGPMFTTLHQVGGTVGTEDPVNRTITIPNSVLQGTWVINYTPEMLDEKIMLPTSEATSYLLDETVWRITFDSDWDEAERIMIEAAKEVTADIIKETGKMPYVRSDIYDYGVYMRLRYMAPATDRPRVMHEINKKIFEKISESKKVDFAIPFIYSYKRGMNFITRPFNVELANLVCQCGTLNPSNATFCSNCGKKITRPT
ncbi:MAG: mechanosensitive ion channel domain-containing protein [Thermoproteota archaeon]